MTSSVATLCQTEEGAAEAIPRLTFSKVRHRFDSYNEMESTQCSSNLPRSVWSKASPASAPVAGFCGPLWTGCVQTFVAFVAPSRAALGPGRHHCVSPPAASGGNVSANVSVVVLSGAGRTVGRGSSIESSRGVWESALVASLPWSGHV